MRVCVHVERLSGRRAQRDELHGRHDVLPSSDDQVKALALSRDVKASRRMVSQVPSLLRSMPFTVETVSSS